MGQKVHPGGLRVGVIHDWKSNWMVGKKEFAGALIEDIKIREHILKKLSHAGLSDILIRKDKQRITIDIYTARPGIVIGKSGVEVDALRKEVHAMTQKNVHININEIKRPELDAKLVAQSIAEQLQNRVSFRRAMKRSLASAIRSGRRRREGAVLGPPRRLRDEPLGAVLRGPRAAAHDSRRHRLRLRRGEDPDRPHRRQGLDQQGRDHAARATAAWPVAARRPASATRTRHAAAAASPRVSAPRASRAATGTRIARGSAPCAAAVPASAADRAVPVAAAQATRPGRTAHARRLGRPRTQEARAGSRPPSRAARRSPIATAAPTPRRRPRSRPLRAARRARGEPAAEDDARSREAKRRRRPEEEGR